MKRKTILFGSIGAGLLIVALLVYFFYFQSPSRQVLAQVNGEKITVEEFKQEISKLEDPLGQMYSEEPQPFLEEIIVKKLLLQEAKSEGITPPVKTYKDKEKDALSPEEFLISELMKKKFSAPPNVTQEEIKNFYAMFKTQMGGKTLDQVSPAIEQLIREGKQQEQVRAYVGELRSKGKIEIDQIRLQKIAAKPPESNTEEEFKNALAAGKPLLVDFGANSCVPCRQLRPVLKDLRNEYSGKAEILVIDVYKHQTLAKEYKIMLIPTLVFFDSKGKEAFRHTGVLDKDKIVAKLKEIGMAS
jgi:thioredoxin 1